MKLSLEALVVLSWTTLTGGGAVGGVIRAREYLGEGQPPVAAAYAVGATAMGALMLWPYVSLWRDQRRVAYLGKA